jgi:hypothetical protein
MTNDQVEKKKATLKRIALSVILIFIVFSSIFPCASGHTQKNQLVELKEGGKHL